jgi:hypothetical protein
VKNRILIALCLVLVLAVPNVVLARGPLTNIWASWANVTIQPDTITYTFPFDTRDVFIKNSSAVAIVVNLTGGTINSSNGWSNAGGLNYLNRNYLSDNLVTPSVIQIDAGDEISMSDYVTDSISMVAIGASAASPVTIIVTY